MSYLEKNFIIHSRGEDGKLLPIDYYVKELKADIQFIPLTRGAVLDIGVKLKQEIDKGEKSDVTGMWQEIICKQLVKPKLTVDELKNGLKPIINNDKSIDILDVFVNALYEISGVNFAKGSDEKKN